MYESDKLKAHGKRVVETVGKAVVGLKEIEKLVPILRSLGKNHVMKGVLPEHYSIVRDALLMTLSGALGDNWNDAVANAWKSTYKVLAETMAFGENVDEAIAKA